MAEVTVTLNGRTYRLECDDGEEDHLKALSEQVGVRLDQMRQQFGQVGDERLLLMAALMIADDLSEANKKLKALEQEKASVGERLESAESQVAEQITAAAERIEVLSAALENGGMAAKGE